jgi:hypothetical protein
MIPKAVSRALTLPQLETTEFHPTKWDSAEQKAQFGNKLLKFIADDFPRHAFTKQLYRRLHLTFGHIANYNLDGFYSTFFETTFTKIEFIEQTISWPCWGDSEHTYCDLERAIIKRVRMSGILEILQAQLASETRASELKLLDRLKQKYEPKRDTIRESLPVASSTMTMTQTSFLDLLPIETSLASARSRIEE